MRLVITSAAHDCFPRAPLDVRGHVVSVVQAGRSTLPFQRANREERHETAFRCNELVETGTDSEVVRQYLVTAGEPTRVDLAEFALRPELCTPVMSAE
ncbi:hypothetical protein J8N05_01105 [Streptomyces sp. BH-SS-21]|uniref:Uncharacterized protein n=1 Tax=Streptomyces liliiviolaceus TaxID=2823109 RepID=A0A940XP32_9ACTN|nr:hypothetical protein [Streptomyces liliiviolaceus]MBQ0846818.1 hypothetical protein [Streptomyces liliiviolaceus]